MRWAYYSFREGFLYVCEGLLCGLLFMCLCWALWRMFSIEGVVSASGLYRLMLLEDVGTGVELFPGNGLALLGLDLDFVLSRRLPICRRRSGQRVQFAGWSVASRPARL